ncbi:MAG: nucleotidyltransferase domain-containing protein [Candidatus Acididesulfobacter diazotrophicus]|jgi:predicted nucleotidyltransferase|uniref:Nucleotidyltransferase domain-containing protein n=1 Tax=Candidatus Acididesulfobacter diazotrophicus TaxID=2597226 RepID=A0A519BK00_9DELT|nr:MAG: nucleotidyltransferase domain-containing protein [Candidatus Acididesulfobacter diazotrophicus]
MAKRKNNTIIVSQNYILIHEIINKYINELKKHNIDLVSVYLFGSYAKGTATEFSDIDLAIIVNKFAADGKDIGDAIDFMSFLMKITNSNYIEPHPILKEDFDETYPFALEILESGKKIL